MNDNKKVYMSVIRSNTMNNESKGKILALKEEYEKKYNEVYEVLEKLWDKKEQNHDILSTEDLKFGTYNYTKQLCYREILDSLEELLK